MAISAESQRVRRSRAVTLFTAPVSSPTPTVFAVGLPNEKLDQSRADSRAWCQVQSSSPYRPVQFSPQGLRRRFGIQHYRW